MRPTVFLTKAACDFFQIYGPPPEEWFESLSSEYVALPIFRNSSGDTLIYTAQEVDALQEARVSALLTSQNQLFPEIRVGRRREAFNRVLRVLQSAEDHSTPIPALWKPYNANSLISIQATTRVSGTERILVDRKDAGNVYATCYGVIEQSVDVHEVMPELVDQRVLRARFVQIAKESLAAGLPKIFEDSFDLEATNIALGLGDNLQTWYESKLTTTQRQFVDTPLSKSLRVRGPAGSGKTIAMVVKILRLLLADRIAQRARRYAFLTHSQATVDLIRSMFRTMISESELSAIEESQTLYLGTLYSFAFETLGTEIRGVEPLSLDGRQGREMQSEMLHSVLRDYISSSWIARSGGCSPSFISKLKAAADGAPNENEFLREILNEFACVIEPDGIARSQSKRNEYQNKAAREPWRLQLETPDERGVILDLHREFRTQMRGAECISVDQLVSDFDRFLGSNAWELTRDASGFDAIFVDELHLLNRLERMIVLSLMRDVDTKPVVVMAEDVKQDALRVSYGLRNWQGQFEQVENFEFKDVFRYTPQINTFLKSIDDFAPTLHLDEDWPQYGQVSRLPDGPVPRVYSFANAKEQYEEVFAKAAMVAKRKKNGRLVAVIGCSYDNFKRYLIAGQHKNSFIPVESRDDIASIPNRGLKFVFSMPEFVAGLQFEEVFLIDVSRASFTDAGSAGVQDKRRALATIYLGASRAMKALHISSLAEEGGNPPCIAHSLAIGACEEAPKL